MALPIYYPIPMSMTFFFQIYFLPIISLDPFQDFSHLKVTYTAQFSREV